MDMNESTNNKDPDKDKEVPQGPPFNPEDLQKEFSELVQKRFGGQVQVLSMDSGLGLNPDERDGEPEQNQREACERAIANFNLKPKEIKEYLDRFAIGQDEAKRALSIAVCDHYNHLRHEMTNKNSLKHYQKQNVLVLGPTGVGKTYLVKLISQLLGVPFVKADATRFSEVGYMGANVDDIIRDLVEKAGGNHDLAQMGIVYVDEVDKLASKKDDRGRDVSGRGVQFGFLRLMENTDVDLNASHDIASQFRTFMNFQKKGQAAKEIINTKNILFIFSGAFHGLEDIVSGRLNKKSIGLHSKKKVEKKDQLLKLAEAEDLVHFGFEHEFIGRLPVRVSCDHLSKRDLLEILNRSEHSIVKQYIESFRLYGIQLKFTQGALKLLAEKAHKQKTGARALSAVFENILRAFKFELPSTRIKELEVNEELIKNPEGYLLHLISN